MKTRLINLLTRLRSSYWFLPTLMASGSVFLAILALAVDRKWEGQLPQVMLLSAASDPEGARAFLSTVSGATITVTGVVFSVTIVALSLASQQFGPRLLINFMRDRVNQAVFGIFIATYIYGLVALRAVQGHGADRFVPQITLLIGFILALFSLGVLIYFIHHVAESIQAMSVIERVSKDLQEAIAQQFPEEHQGAGNQLAFVLPDIPAEFDTRAVDMKSPSSGYLQAVDEPGLLAFAGKHDLLIRVVVYPGQYLLRDTALAEVFPQDRIENAELEELINGAFILGPKRSSEQGIEYLVNELVEIALRAISPGINDPFTAINCINHLGSALRELAARDVASPCRFDKENKLRLVVRRQNFQEVVDMAFDPIRRHGRGYAEITIRLLDMIAELIPHAGVVEDRQSLLRQAEIIKRDSSVLPCPEDQQIVHQRHMDIYRVVEKQFGLTGEG